jgi:hypothetical protein
LVLTVNAGGGIVLDAEVDVLADSKPEVARVREVLLDQLVLLHLEARLLRHDSGRVASGMLETDYI